MRSIGPREPASPAPRGSQGTLERRAVEAGGLVGTLIVPPAAERRNVAVVVLGGSQGGLVEQVAAAFAEEGFTALALAYFGAGALPPALLEVPVEYVGRAIEWLRAQPEAGDRRVGLVGRSKGGELALRAAATYPANIGAVVGYTPSPVVWQGLPGDRRGWREGPKSSWTLDGSPLPFLPFAKPRARELPRFLRSTLAGSMALRPIHERALAGETARERATTPIERIAGPILVISGTDDQLWPAPTLCELAMRRLKRHRHPFPDRHLTYEGAGHLIGPPGHRALDAGRFAVGGTPDADARASADAWPQVLGFLERHL